MSLLEDRQIDQRCVRDSQTLVLYRLCKFRHGNREKDSRQMGREWKYEEDAAIYMYVKAFPRLIEYNC